LARTFFRLTKSPFLLLHERRTRSASTSRKSLPARCSLKVHSRQSLRFVCGRVSCSIGGRSVQFRALALPRCNVLMLINVRRCCCAEVEVKGEAKSRSSIMVRLLAHLPAGSRARSGCPSCSALLRPMRHAPSLKLARNSPATRALTGFPFSCCAALFFSLPPQPVADSRASLITADKDKHFSVADKIRGLVSKKKLRCAHLTFERECRH
jgi:hypothetical protein